MQLYIETGITSRELSERLPFDAMCRYYPGIGAIQERKGDYAESACRQSAYFLSGRFKAGVGKSSAHSGNIVVAVPEKHWKEAMKVIGQVESNGH